LCIHICRMFFCNSCNDNSNNRWISIRHSIKLDEIAESSMAMEGNFNFNRNRNRKFNYFTDNDKVNSGCMDSCVCLII
jgi:hypothetical protein